MKHALGIAVLVIAAFLALGALLFARMAGQAPERRDAFGLAFLAALTVLITSVLTAAGMELIHG